MNQYKKIKHFCCKTNCTKHHAERTIPDTCIKTIEHPTFGIAFLLVIMKITFFFPFCCSECNFRKRIKNLIYKRLDVYGLLTFSMADKRG